MQGAFDFSRANPIDAAALAVSPVPIAGDIAGLLNDARHYMQNPETRSLGNYALSAAGVLPLIPPVMGATRALRPSQVDMRIRQMAYENDVRHGAINENTPGVDPDEIRAIKAEQAAEAGPQPKGLLDDTPRGAAPERTDYSLLRFRAPQGSSARFNKLMERFEAAPEMADEMRSIVRAGEEVGREWYNTEALRDMFIKELGPKAGPEAWKEFMWLVGATSTGSKVPPNIRNASYWFTKNRPGDNSGVGALSLDADALLAGEMVPPVGSGYGHKMQRNQAKNVGKYVTGDWGPTADPRLNPKPRGFTQSLLGGRRNIAADKHFMRLMSMMSDDPAFLHGSAEISNDLVKRLRDQFGKKINPFITKRDVDGKTVHNFNAKAAVKGKKGSKTVKAAKPVDGVYDFIKKERSVWEDMPNANEYKAFEDFTNKLAGEMGMTGPQLQAAFWMGAAQRTGVDPLSQRTFMEIFNDLASQRAAERGLSKQQVIKNFMRRNQPLALPLAAVGGAGLLGAGED